MEQNPAKKFCANCKSKRWRVHRAGLCKKCFYWHQKIIRLEKNLMPGKSITKKPNDFLAKYRKRVARRVLEEFAWREKCLNSENVSPFDVEAIIYAVAAECRSEVDFALHSWLAEQTPDARKCFFTILLSIVENIPARRPRLHLLHPPKKMMYWDGWSEWSRSSPT